MNIEIEIKTLRSADIWLESNLMIPIIECDSARLVVRDFYLATNEEGDECAVCQTLDGNKQMILPFVCYVFESAIDAQAFLNGVEFDDRVLSSDKITE